ncbi:MAG: VWA domain-containing protein [Myxococcota bacterium]
MAIGIGINVQRHMLGAEAPLELEMFELEADNRFVRAMNRPAAKSESFGDDEAGGQGYRHKGEEGRMGRPSSKNRSGLYAMKGPRMAAPQMARSVDPQMAARNAGILGMMQQESGQFLASPYGAAFAVGQDDTDVWGGVREKEGVTPRAKGGRIPEAGPVPEAKPVSGAERYRQWQAMAFTSAADDAVSTFSIDVDTGSYSLVRQSLVEHGAVPPRPLVRVEEMINYFDYAYPEPSGEVPISITSEVGPCPWDDEHRLVHVGLQGKHVAPGAVPPRNLVFLIDVSGSMSDDLSLVVSSLAYLTEQLGEQDRISIVVYAGAAGMVLPPTAGSDKAQILGALARLEAGGSTNGGQGIHLAYQLAQQHFVEGGINRVILATDGDFNVGVTGQDALVELIEQKRRSGVFLSVLGYGGGNYRDGTMEQLADKGNGNYAYIDGLAEARKVLVEQAGATLVTIAKDVKIQVEFEPDAVERYRLVGYTNRVLADRDFADDTKDAGEVGAGHTVTALYEVVPREGAEADEPLMELRLRYKEPDGHDSRLVKVPVSDAGAELSQTSDDFRFSAAVAWFGQGLQGVPTKGEPGSLRELRDLARDARGADRHCRRAELVGLVERASRMTGQPLDPTRLSCTPSDEPGPVVYAEPLSVQKEEADAGESFDWARFVKEVLYLLPPLLALPLFVMALRRPRRRREE